MTRISSSPSSASTPDAASPHSPINQDQAQPGASQQAGPSQAPAALHALPPRSPQARANVNTNAGTRSRARTALMPSQSCGKRPHPACASPNDHMHRLALLLEQDLPAMARQHPRKVTSSHLVLAQHMLKTQEASRMQVARTLGLNHHTLSDWISPKGIVLKDETTIKNSPGFQAANHLLEASMRASQQQADSQAALQAPAERRTWQEQLDATNPSLLRPQRTWQEWFDATAPRPVAAPAAAHMPQAVPLLPSARRTPLPLPVQHAQRPQLHRSASSPDFNALSPFDEKPLPSLNDKD